MSRPLERRVRVYGQINVASPDFHNHACARLELLHWLTPLIDAPRRDPNFSPVFVKSWRDRRACRTGGRQRHHHFPARDDHGLTRWNPPRRRPSLRSTTATRTSRRRYRSSRCGRPSAASCRSLPRRRSWWRCCTTSDGRAPVLKHTPSASTTRCSATRLRTTSCAAFRRCTGRCSSAPRRCSSVWCSTAQSRRGSAIARAIRPRRATASTWQSASRLQESRCSRWAPPASA